MSQGYSKVYGSFAFLAMACAVQAQQGNGWGATCFDPKNTMPRSADFGEQQQFDSIMGAVLGVSGTVTFGGPSTDAPPGCFSPAITANLAGRIGFGAGPTGSIQSTFDDGMSFTFGYPIPGGTWGYATLTTDSKLLDGYPIANRTLFGPGGFTTTFVGASDRYIFAEEVDGMTTIDLRIDLIGDAARLQWQLTNNDIAASHTLGLWVGLWTAMDSNGALSGFANGPGPTVPITEKQEYVSIPGKIPPTVEQRYMRATDSSGFPTYVDFDFGQTLAYGLRVEAGPNPDTEDATGLNSDCTQSDEFVVGQSFFLLDAPAGSDQKFPDITFGQKIAGTNVNAGGDVTYLDSPAYIQKYYEQAVPSGAARTIVQYYHSTWAVSNYFKPYTVTIDAPPVMATDLSTSTGIAAGSGPNGTYILRVYVDNTRGFSTADQSIELENVNVTLKLPNGLNLASGETATKVIPRVDPGGVNLAFVDYHIIPDGIAYGQLPYSVTVAPTPGPTKVLNGIINVASTPKLNLAQGPNLIGTPWTFSDSSWEAILGLVEGTDFQAYQWDPIQNGYITSTSATRGIGNWIVATNAIGIRALQSNPQTPSDQPTGAPLINLQAGWNLISNPYSYAIPVGQIIGATNANPQQDFVWSQLVSQGFVNGAVGFFDPVAQSYNYLQNGTDLLQPNVGYWVFVGVAQPLTLKFPPVFEEYLPNSNRSFATPWTQTDNQWRLQITGRQGKSIDDKNFVGVAATPALVKSLQVAKPPVMPAKVAGVSVAFNQTVNGKPMRMAQVLSTGATRQSYTMTVTTPTAGDVVLTWPNISTIPKTVQVRIVDTANGNTRIMNTSSGYTFTTTAGATRTFQVQLQPQVPGRATIGNVIVTRTSRSPGAPVAISYTLGVTATTQIQILNAAGTTVYNLVNGRSDQSGLNSATWNLKDNANRNVAPGTYKVVISVATADGSTARKMQTVNVTR